jgi:hypothetical protein
MTLTTKFFARETPWLVMFSVFVGAVIVASGIVIGSNEGGPKKRALCDEAVHGVPTTKDPVELQRNIFLVRHLDCSISRRL